MIHDDYLWNAFRTKLINSKVMTNVGVIDVLKDFVLEMEEEFVIKTNTEKEKKIKL